MFLTVGLISGFVFLYFRFQLWYFFVNRQWTDVQNVESVFIFMFFMCVCGFIRVFCAFLFFITLISVVRCSEICYVALLICIKYIVTGLEQHVLQKPKPFHLSVSIRQSPGFLLTRFPYFMLVSLAVDYINNFFSQTWCYVKSFPIQHCPL